MDESPAVVCDSGAVKLTAPPLCQEKYNECAMEKDYR